MEEVVNAVVGVGGSYRVGSAEVVREGTKLVLRDSYTERALVVPKTSRVEVVAVPPVNVPKKVADFIYLEFSEPVMLKDGMSFWTLGPYELAVLVDGQVVTYLSPLKVKNTLYGDVFDGLICRYRKAPVTFEEPRPGDAEAPVKVEVKASMPKLLEGLLIRADQLDLYLREATVYYELVRLTVVRRNRVNINLLNKPPVEGATKLKTIIRPPGLVKKLTYVMRG